MKRCLGWVTVMTVSSCLFLISACFTRPIRIAFNNQYSIQAAGSPGITALGSWDNLKQIKPGSQVAVYLENGGRMLQKFRGFTDSQIDLDINGFDRNRIVAVALAPKDRLVDGVLMGSGTGVGVGLGWGRALSDDGDFSGPFAAIASLYGLAVGSGVGALLDAGMANPERPVYMREGSGPPLSRLKQWKLSVPRHELFHWILGRKVELMLKDGTYMKGRTIQGSDRAMELVTTESSEKSYKGRKVTIPTEQISTIAYRENIGGNRVAATLGGALGGLFTGALLGLSFNYNSADETQLVVGAGLGTLLGSGLGLGLAEHYNFRNVLLVVK